MAEELFGAHSVSDLEDTDQHSRVELMEKVEDLKMEKQTMQLELDEMKKELTRVNDKLTDMAEETKSLQQDLETALREKDALSAQLRYQKQEPENTDLHKESTHDQQMVLAQKETIEKLNTWIENEGKPAILKSEELQLQTDEQQQKMSQMQMELQTVRNELAAVSEEKKALQDNYDDAAKETEILTRQHTENRTELEKASKSVNEYEAMQKKVKELQSASSSLQSEYDRLQQEYEAILQINQQFESTNASLQEQLKHRTDELEAAKAANVEKDEEIIRLQAGLEQAEDDLAGKDEVIEDLKDKFRLTQGDGLEYKPVTNNAIKTLRMPEDAYNQNRTLRTNRFSGQFASRFSGFQDTLRTNQYSDQNTFGFSGVHGVLYDDDSMTEAKQSEDAWKEEWREQMASEYEEKMERERLLLRAEMEKMEEMKKQFSQQGQNEQISGLQKKLDDALQDKLVNEVVLDYVRLMNGGS